MAKVASEKNMANLLPKIKKTHLEANMLTHGRQDKIMTLLKSDMLSPKLKETTSRKYFRNPSTDLNTDLGPITASQKGLGLAFFTAVPTPKRSERNSRDMTSFNNKKNSTAVPSLPNLTKETDFLSR